MPAILALPTTTCAATTPTVTTTTTTAFITSLIISPAPILPLLPTDSPPASDLPAASAPPMDTDFIIPMKTISAHPDLHSYDDAVPTSNRYDILLSMPDTDTDDVAGAVPSDYPLTAKPRRKKHAKQLRPDTKPSPVPFTTLPGPSSTTPSSCTSPPDDVAVSCLILGGATPASLLHSSNTSHASSRPQPAPLPPPNTSNLSSPVLSLSPP
ncbi:mucin-2-like [Bacillus rossius redtenbacheri]|uniref:mucin-2-like n=1 Tax=Bacillus rossius redtenbacheri TaxID=93214 RepID=UPI002FDEF260